MIQLAGEWKLNEIQPVEYEKNCDEGIKDKPDNHNHVKDLRVFVAILGVHVFYRLRYAQVNVTLAQDSEKSQGFLSFQGFTFFLTCLIFWYIVPSIFFPVYLTVIILLGGGEWNKNKAKS